MKAKSGEDMSGRIDGGDYEPAEDRSAAFGLLGQLEALIQQAELLEKKAANSGASWHCYMISV